LRRFRKTDSVEAEVTSGSRSRVVTVDVSLWQVLRNQMTPLIIDCRVILFRNILTPGYSVRVGVRGSAALVIIAQCNTLVARCSRQLIGPADWVFVTLGPLRCD